MKKIILILVALYSVHAVAQTDTTSTTISSKKAPYQNQSLFGSGVLVGGFGALSVKATNIENDDVVMMGMKGAFVFGHNLNVGLAGYGFLSPMNLGSQDTLQYGGGYGGLFFEPVLWSDKMIHVAFPMIVGAGGIASFNKDDNYYQGNNSHLQEASAFFVFEPGVVVEVNIVDNVRLDIGGTYRVTSGLDLPDVSNDALNGFSLEVSVKVGVF